MSARSLARRVTRPLVGYFDHRFADVQERIREQAAEIERLRADLARLDRELAEFRRAVGADADAVHEVALGAERALVEVRERLEALLERPGAEHLRGP